MSIDRISVLYATYRDRPDAERTAVAAALREVTRREGVLLETCHRAELIAVDVRSTSATAHRVVSGRDAVRRVFEVVAGFDSAVVAEEQLLGQVRQAYNDALASGRSGPILNELLRRAIRFGRRVRSHARPGSDRSLAERGVGWLLEHIPADARVLVAGTGEMGHAAAARLAAAGHPVAVISRSADRATRLIERLPPGGHHRVTGDMSAALTDVAAVVLAVRSRQPLLGTDTLDGHRPWTLDLSSPPAVDAAAGPRLGERLLDLDGLGKLVATQPVLAPRVEDRLRRELGTEVERFVGWLHARRTSNAVAILHAEAGAVRDQHLEELRRRSDLAPEQLALFERVTASMFGDLLHRPSAALRRGDADAAVVRRLFGIEG